MSKAAWIGRAVLGALLLAGAGSSAQAQNSDLVAPCGRLGATTAAAARDWCLQAAQAAASAQPQLGILIAAGNPVLGAGRAGSGIRLGLAPQASITAKLNLVGTHLPELRSGQAAAPGSENGTLNAVAPAISGTVMLNVFSGASLAPMLAGIGSIDLLGQATYLPFRAFNTAGFGDRSPDLAYGAGARVGIVRESFVLPGASVSAMYRRLGDVSFGNVCQGTIQSVTSDQSQEYTFQQGVCGGTAGVQGGRGDPGEFTFDLSNTSVRALLSKRVAMLGLAAGVGYDWWNSDLAFGFRAPGDPRFYRAVGLGLDTRRLSLFANTILSLPFLGVALEGGWLEGGSTLPEFDTARSDFDAGAGTWFGSLGVRLSL